MADRIFSSDYWVDFGRRAVELITSRGALILALVIGYFLVRAAAYRVVDTGIARLVAHSEREGYTVEGANRLRTLQGIVKGLCGVALLFILIVMLLDAVGANISGIVATAGVGGLALGFGAQKLVKDVISGFFFIVEDQFVVGDYVTIGAATGVVEEVGMRITRIRDDQGKVWILANGDISTVVNHSRAPVESFIEIGIHPSADVDAVEKLIDQAGKALFDHTKDRRLVEPPVSTGISGWDAARILIRVKIKAEPKAVSEEQLRVRQAIHSKLVEAGIHLA